MPTLRIRPPIDVAMFPHLSSRFSIKARGVKIKYDNVRLLEVWSWCPWHGRCCRCVNQDGKLLSNAREATYNPQPTSVPPSCSYQQSLRLLEQGSGNADGGIVGTPRPRLTSG